MDERLYLQQRAGEEVQLASNAADERAKAAHAAMADEYVRRLKIRLRGRKA